MTELQKFNFKDNEVRIHKDENGEPWFVAADVCRVLGIKNVSKATSQLDEDEFTTLTFSYTGESGKVVPHRVNLISESGLYALILRSNKPEAKPFRKWVTSEVLPAIRKTGAYIAKELDSDTLLATLYAEMEKRVKAEAERDQYRRNLERIALVSNLNYGSKSKTTGLPMDIVVAPYVRSSSKEHEPQEVRFVQLVLPLKEVMADIAERNGFIGLEVR